MVITITFAHFVLLPAESHRQVSLYTYRGMRPVRIVHEMGFKESFTNTPLVVTERVVVPNASLKTSPTVSMPTLN